MKYKLLKDLPWINAWEILSELQDTYPYSPQHKTVSWIFANAHPDFFEHIVEKKTYDDLKRNDMIFEIDYDWSVYKSYFEVNNCRSETFLSREEAKDEHKRREWTVRPDKFMPKSRQIYYTFNQDWGIEENDNFWDYLDRLIINAWLAFRTREDCEKAIKEHDLTRLFYTIR
jgi:hypothetical protein